MNIGFDAKRLFHNETGLGNYSRTLVRNLLQYYPDNQYHLYTPTLSNNGLANYIISHDNVYTTTSDGLQEEHWRSFGIKKSINRDNVRIYHGLSHELPRNNDKLTCRKVVTIHDLIFKRHPSFFPLTDRAIYELKCRHAIKTADIIVAISENTKRDIVEFYKINPDKIKVVYQSCEPIFFNQETENTLDLPQKYNLCVGSIEKRKNQITLLHAYAQLPSSMQIPLLLVGKGKKYMKEVRSLIETLGLRKIVKIMTNVPSYDLPELYRRAHLFIYPSLYEGFGLPVAEAMLCGTPVITSNNSSLTEAGGPMTQYVNPQSMVELCNAITMLTKDAEMRTKMIEDGRNYALHHFSAQATTEKMMNVYRS